MAEPIQYVNAEGEPLYVSSVEPLPVSIEAADIDIASLDTLTESGVTASLKTTGAPLTFQVATIGTLSGPVTYRLEGSLDDSGWFNLNDDGSDHVVTTDGVRCHHVDFPVRFVRVNGVDIPNNDIGPLTAVPLLTIERRAAFSNDPWLDYGQSLTLNLSTLTLDGPAPILEVGFQYRLNADYGPLLAAGEQNGRMFNLFVSHTLTNSGGTISSNRVYVMNDEDLTADEYILNGNNPGTLALTFSRGEQVTQVSTLVGTR